MFFLSSTSLRSVGSLRGDSELPRLMCRSPPPQAALGLCAWAGSSFLLVPKQLPVCLFLSCWRSRDFVRRDVIGANCP